MMSVWPVDDLGRYLRVRHGYAFKGEFFGGTGDYIVVTPGNFFEGGGFRRVSAKDKFYSGVPPPEFVLSKDDLVVAMTEQSEGLLGSSALIPEDGLFLHNQRIGLVELGPTMDRRYAYYLFNSCDVRRQIQATATGSKVRHTAPSRIEAVRVAVPPLSTQRKIAAILSAYDDLIENNLRRIKLLEEMAQRIYREWFVDLRYPGHDAVPLVDSDVAPIPHGWLWTSVGEVATNFDRKRKPLSGIQRAMRPGPYPYFGAARIFDYIDGYLFDGVYLLVAEDGSVVTPDGYPVLQYVTGKFWANNHTHVLQGRAVSTEFLHLMLQSQSMTGYVTGAAQPKVTQANLNRIPVLLPPRALVDAFDEHVAPVYGLITRLDRQTNLARSTRDLLLPRLMSGELDVDGMGIPGAAA